MLQGDGWRGLQVRKFDSGEKAHINAIILSNTCDVSPENKRELPVRIVFAPLIALNAYERLLVEAGISKDSVRSKIDAVKRQKVTNVFYLPARGGLDGDHMVLLDDVHAVPARTYSAERTAKIFTLSQAGFYLFILKLLIHFCRFHENLGRA
jgi:hypothetical protein